MCYLRLPADLQIGMQILMEVEVDLVGLGSRVDQYCKIRTRSSTSMMPFTTLTMASMKSFDQGYLWLKYYRAVLVVSFVEQACISGIRHII